MNMRSALRASILAGLIVTGLAPVSPALAQSFDSNIHITQFEIASILSSFEVSCP